MPSRRVRVSLRAACLAWLVFAAAFLWGVRPVSAGSPLATAIYDPGTFSGDQGDLAFARAKQTGASFVDLQIYWVSIAPAKPPSGFKAADPADPSYNWSVIDRQ